MKYDAIFLVIRLNNEVIDVYGLEDMYSICQIRLDSNNLSDEDIKNFYSGMSESYVNNMVKEVRENGYILEEQEAKDLTCNLSKYTITIEHKEIEFV